MYLSGFPSIEVDMPLTKSEDRMRDMVEAIHKRLDVSATDTKDAIRGAALSMFVKELEAKIANLQIDETLQITFRVDILGADGKVRAGQGYERNMPEYAVWRTAVYVRDNYTCQNCLVQGGELNAHHIASWAHYPELRFDVGNGTTLCVDCHALRHPHLKFMNHGSSNKN